MYKAKICIVGSFANSLINFRGTLISNLIRRGCKVYVLAPDFTMELERSVMDLGAVPIKYYLSRARINPIKDIITIVSLVKIFRNLKPDLIFTYTHKPNIYGMLSAALTKIPKRFAEITGIGYYFIKGSKAHTVSYKLTKSILVFLYRISFLFVDMVFFLNKEDLMEFVDLRILPRNKCKIIPATGVDLNEWKIATPLLEPITFIFVGRLLKEKGVLEYVEAARIIKEKHPQVKFIMLGGYDENPGSLTPDDIKKLQLKGLLTWPGDVPDVRPWLAQSSVFVLPSYREGFPRSTQEAMAMGRPIITTDAPGCRETVKHGLNGFLVPVGNVRALAEAMEEFINNPDLIPVMGRESRRMAEVLFDAVKNNQSIINHFGLE
jgi:glycosyltransferase involved in cell wall biosynthesis